jgi:hypothetical protein
MLLPKQPQLARPIMTRVSQNHQFFVVLDRGGLAQNWNGCELLISGPLTSPRTGCHPVATQTSTDRLGRA